jgi:hypothetical protein
LFYAGHGEPSSRTPTGSVIAVHGLDGTLKGEFTVEGATGPLTILNADLVAWLGGETDFRLRAYAERGGFRSLDPDELTVRFL